MTLDFSRELPVADYCPMCGRKTMSYISSTGGIFRKCPAWRSWWSMVTGENHYMEVEVSRPTLTQLAHYGKFDPKTGEKT